MQQAIERLRTTRTTFYRWLRTGKIKGLKIGRQWRFRPEDIERFVCGQEPRIDLPVGADSAIAALQSAMNQAGISSALPSHDDPIVRLVDGLVLLAMRSGASDIHVEPMREAGVDAGVAMVRLRLDGVLHEAMRFDLRLLPAVVERIKRVAACDPMVKTRPQDGRIIMEKDGTPVDLRVTIAPTFHGEAVTIRLLSREAVALTLDQMPYAERDMRVLREAINAPYGMVIMAGPTGSGKTTALYCALTELNRPEMKLITIEDPVEYAFSGIMQMQVNPKEGMTFDAAMRSALRSDPDVIMVGEIQTKGMMHLSLQAALTGHLVLTQMHTNSAADTLMRIRSLNIEDYIIGEAIRLVVAQRLVRRLCPHCGEPTSHTGVNAEQAVAMAKNGGLNWDELPKQFRRAVGCDKCSHTGYRGRTVLVETMPMTAQIATALRRGAGEEELESIAVGQGMTTLAADGVRRAANGETTLQEVMRVIGMK